MVIIGNEIARYSSSAEQYRLAIAKPIAGLAFDLDGTALDTSHSLPQKIKTITGFQLRAGIPIVVATGRGLGSTDEMVVSQLPPESLKNLYVANYNGCVVTKFEVSTDAQGNKHVSPTTLFEAPLERGDAIFKALVEEAPFKNDLTIQPTDKIKFTSKVRRYGITLVFEDGKLPTREEITAFLHDAGYTKEEVQVLFSGKTYDIISTKGGKNNAIAEVARVCGINAEDIARVGDQGEEGENDHDMLTNGKGFYVGPTLGKATSSMHSVYSPSGERLSGANALTQLLKDVILTPHVTLGESVFNNPSERSQHLDSYANSAKDARERFSNLTASYEAMVLQNNQLVDLETSDVDTPIHSELFNFNGAVKLTQQEFHSLPEGPLREFLLTPSDASDTSPQPRYRYHLHYGNSQMVYCRAEGYYTTMKEASSSGERFTRIMESAQDIFSRYQDITTYIKNKDKLSVGEWKATLAFLDHYKSICLQTFHAFSYLKTMGLLHQSDFTNAWNEQLRQITARGVSSFYNFMDMKKTDFPRPEANNFLLQTMSIVRSTLHSLHGDVAKKGEKAVRGISETDNPYYNRIYAIAAANTISRMDSTSVILAGMHYGGLELPFIVQRELVTKGISAELVAAHYSKYSNKYLPKGISSLSQIIDRQIEVDGKDVFIIDDGVFSGESLYRLGLLFAKEGAIPTLSVQSIGTSRRLGHLMTAGGVNPEFLDSELQESLVRVSPFKSVKKSASFLTEDSFNLVKARVRRQLRAAYGSSTVRVHGKA